MATLWEVGDKAACVWKIPCNDGLEVGKVYTISEIFVPCLTFAGEPHVGLNFAELPCNDKSVCPLCEAPIGWASDRFRKVVPDKAESGEVCEQLLKLAGKTPVRETEDA
jgi:hypothetical protein